MKGLLQGDNLIDGDRGVEEISDSRLKLSLATILILGIPSDTTIEEVLEVRSPVGVLSLSEGEDLPLIGLGIRQGDEARTDARPGDMYSTGEVPGLVLGLLGLELGEHRLE